MKIKTITAFSTPIFEVPLPAFEPHREEVIKLFSDKIDSGEIKPHQHGYGYQTPTTLFFPSQYPQRYFVEVLGKGFLDACERILYQHAHVDSGKAGGYAWMNTLTLGWANIQTGRTWDTDPPWHSHRPATLSGCYYVNVNEKDDEGRLEFMNPGTDTVFQPQTFSIKPKAGHMVIFPSYLRHRPTRCPSTRRPRIALCIDSHWAIQMPHQLPPGARPRR